MGSAFSINTPLRHGEFSETTQMPPRAASRLTACKWQVNGCPGAFLSRGIKNHERTCPFKSENIVQADPGLNLDIAGNYFHMIFCSTKCPTDENFIGANALLAAAGVLAPSGLRSLIEDDPESGEAIQGVICVAFISEIHTYFLYMCYDAKMSI